MNIYIYINIHIYIYMYVWHVLLQKMIVRLLCGNSFLRTG